MSMDEETAYLQPDFDPNSLKVPELRNLLLEYDVDYPSAAKKAVLVDLFNEHIAPRAQRIAERRRGVRASSRGIVSVDRMGNALVEEPRRGSRRVRGKSAADTDSEPGGTSDVLDSATSSTMKKTPARRTASPSKRSVTGRHSRIGTEDLGEAETPRTVRRTRRSGATAADLVPETPAPPQRQQTEEPADDPEKSPFSMENVFQKTPVSSASKENQRKPERVSSRPGRRLTDFLTRTDLTRTEPEPEEARYNRRITSVALNNIQDPETPPYNRQATSGDASDAVAQPFTKRYEVPISRLGSSAPMPIVTPDRAVVKIEKIEDEDLIPAGEEFTPEGAQEVAEAEEEEGVVVPRSSGRRRGSSTPAPASMLWAVVATLLCAYFVWWRKEKIEIGYCGVGVTAPKGLNHNDGGDWANLLRPECEPCPPSAICKPNYIAECKSDYVLVNNPLSLFGLIPLAPTCEPDTEKLRRIAILSDEAIKVLRKRAADVECGDIAPIKPILSERDGKTGKEGEETGKDGSGSGPVAKFVENGPLAQGKGMDERELYQIMHELKAPKLSDEQFNELFKAALEEVAGREEIEAKEDSSTHTLHLASRSLASLTLTCSLRLSLLRTLNTYRVELVSILFSILALLHINYTIRQRRQKNELVKKYVHLVLNALMGKAEVAQRTGREEDARVPVVQLRDWVMRGEFHVEKREGVWEGVRKVVELNSNVRAGTREVRGEMFRVWEWIGGLGGLVEGEGVGEGKEMGLSRGVKREEWEGSVEFPRVVA